MVYAPQSEEDVKLLLEVVRAAKWFVSGGDGVEDKEAVEERRDSGYASGDGDFGEEYEGGIEDSALPTQVAAR